MKRNKQLTVYLSKSLMSKESELEPIRRSLSSMGFKVTEYTGEKYTTKKLDEADFVLLVPSFFGSSTYIIPTYHGGLKWSTTVGKGQFSEVERCLEQDLSKPVFIFHRLTHLGMGISVSKVIEESSAVKIISENDWKKNYGVVRSYVRNTEPIDLYPFITGHIKSLKGTLHTPIKDEDISFSNLMMLLD